MEHEEWLTRLQASQDAHAQWMAGMREMLGALTQQTLQINRSLQAVATGVSAHDAQMRVQAERLRQNEETHQALLSVLREIRDRL